MNTSARLPELDPEQRLAAARALDARLVAARGAQRAAEHQLALLLAEMSEDDLYRVLGYISLENYAFVALELPWRTARDLLRLGRCLPSLPVLNAAMAAGQLDWTKARELVRVVTPETEPTWVARAKAVTSRVLEREVAAANFGEAAPAGDPAPERIPARRRVSFDMDAQDAEALQAAIALLRSRSDLDRSEIEDGALIGAMARGVIAAEEAGAPEELADDVSGPPHTADAGPANAEPGTAQLAKPGSWPGSAERGANTGERYRVVVQQCPTCRKVTAPEGDVSPTIAAEALCDAEIIDLRPGPNQGHATRAIAPARGGRPGGGRVGGTSLEVDGDQDGLSECEGDCNDRATNAYPGAPEICDGLDDDCDGVVPADELDVDGDAEMTCEGDCDDDAPSVGHDHLEVCDGLDNDCNGAVDDECISCDLVVPDDFNTIQRGIDGAADGDILCVAAGTYRENLDFNGTDVAVVGYAGPASTTVESYSGGTVVRFWSGETPTARLQGFTITGADSDYDDGGGVEVRNASPTLSNLVVTGNRVNWLGGGISVSSGDPVITNVTISANEVWNYYSYYGFGGGLVLSDSRAVVSNVLIEDNTAGLSTLGDGRSSGAGCLVYDSDVSFTNVRVYGNHVDGDAAGFLVEAGSTVRLSNVIIDANSATGVGGGLFIDATSSAAFTNVNITSNSGGDGGGGVYAEADTVTFSHSNVGPASLSGLPDPNGTNGNISVNPDFYASKGHLNSTSPLVDAGDPAILDPDGSPSDIGAFGGPGAAGWDLDGDGYFNWWLPGPYDPATSHGLDCDDEDATVYPGAGC